MKRVFLVVIIITLLLTGCSKDENREITIHKPSNVEVEMISVKEVKELVDNLDGEENVVIIDVQDDL